MDLSYLRLLLDLKLYSGLLRDLQSSPNQSIERDMSEIVGDSCLLRDCKPVVQTSILNHREPCLTGKLCGVGF